jgi:KUP system potassium uptake protein
VPFGHPGTSGPGLLLGAELACLGVVYGDIGTSPLYAVQAVFALGGGAVRPVPRDVEGVISLVFWSITLVVSVKYVLFVMRADNDGEGGVMALAALVQETLSGAGRRITAMAMTIGVAGAALFYGDSVITPAISVLSAVEGLAVTQPSLSRLVLPLAVAVLTVLFSVQHWGTSRVGHLFGPVMLLWFTAVAAAGLAEVFAHPAIVRALSPSYALVFIAGRPFTAFVAMGAVVLAITGAEALYADIGHFGTAPIRRAWFLLVFPALTLNYLGQGAMVLQHPGARVNPFFLLLPSWARLPMVVLATAATVIASQAVISGAFSLSHQAVRLGLLPQLRVRYTSSETAGQVYLPMVNWALFAAVLTLLLGFRSSARLAGAYGVAVTATFLTTTALFSVVARARWHWPLWRLGPLVAVIGVVEVTYLAANLLKLRRDGWVPLVIATAIFIVMTTWQRGSEIVGARRRELEGGLRDFVGELRERGVPRVVGTAVFPHPNAETTPLALRANVEHNHVRHEHILIVSTRTANVPHIPWRERICVNHLVDPKDGIAHVEVRYGFQDRTDLPEALRRAPTRRLEGGIDADHASYFLSGITLIATRQPTMTPWRKRLFVAIARDTGTQGDYLRLPHHRTLVIEAELEF